MWELFAEGEGPLMNKRSSSLINRLYFLIIKVKLLVMTVDIKRRFNLIENEFNIFTS